MAQTPAAGRVTLAELAAEAEVSLSTISKVLNGQLGRFAENPHES